MAKSVHNDVLDQALNYIKTNTTIMTVCTTEPTTYAEATSTYKLADIAMSSTDFTGPADGDVSGRKVSTVAKNNVAIDTSGTALHVALSDSGASKLLYVTTCTSQALTSGGTVDIPAWDAEIEDPA